ncbi:MAG TPA: hypothetical protein VH307_18735, partial [Streptosporangiaceae bacterium]|nr:hypothetical protein [Streptosporangiaceae bacterium]
RLHAADADAMMSRGRDVMRIPFIVAADIFAIAFIIRVTGTSTDAVFDAWQRTRAGTHGTGSLPALSIRLAREQPKIGRESRDSLHIAEKCPRSWKPVRERPRPAASARAAGPGL